LLTEGVRAGANVNNVNTIGLGVSMSAIIAMYYVFYQKKKINILALPLCVIVTFGTGSIKAFLLLAMGILLITIMNMNPRRRMRSIFKAILWIVIALILFILLLQLPVFETINHRFNGLLALVFEGRWLDSSVKIRFLLSEAGLTQFLKNPLFGIGINNGWNIALATVGNNYYLHNNYVELLVDVGIVGTCLFYAIPVSILRNLWKKTRLLNQKATVVGVIFVCWMVMQIGYVCYFDKITFVYFALGAAAVATISSDGREDNNKKVRLK